MWSLRKMKMGILKFNFICILGLLITVSCSDTLEIQLPPVEEISTTSSGEMEEVEFEECLCDACAEYEGLYCELNCDE